MKPGGWSGRVVKATLEEGLEDVRGRHRGVGEGEPEVSVLKVQSPWVRRPSWPCSYLLLWAPELL